MTASRFFVFALLLLSLGATSCVPSGRVSSGVASSGFSGGYAVALPEFSIPVTREEIKIAFGQYGAMAIVRKLHTDDAANWNMIMNRLAAGDAMWMACVAEYIMPGTNAEASADIVISLAYGLQTNPEAVLMLSDIDPTVSVGAVCSLPFSDSEYGFIENYGQKALAALRGIKKRSLATSRNECVQLLQDNLAKAATEEHALKRL